MLVANESDQICCSKTDSHHCIFDKLPLANLYCRREELNGSVFYPLAAGACIGKWTEMLSFRSPKRQSSFFVLDKTQNKLFP